MKEQERIEQIQAALSAVPMSNPLLPYETAALAKAVVDALSRPTAILDTSKRCIIGMTGGSWARGVDIEDVWRDLNKTEGRIVKRHEIICYLVVGDALAEVNECGSLITDAGSYTFRLGWLYEKKRGKK